MSKEIEEMAIAMAGCGKADCSSCKLRFDGLCASYKDASRAYAAGYRKQSEGEWMTYHCTNGEKSKRGRTIIYKIYTCGVCGKSNGRHKANYCPHCGAKMKGGE